MDSLVARAEALGPSKRKFKNKKQAVAGSKSAPAQTGNSDKTYTSVAAHTSLPRSLRPGTEVTEKIPKHKHIANKRLRTELVRSAAHAARSQALLKDAELLLPGEKGMLEVEDAMERTWRVGQAEIAESSGMEARTGRNEWRLDGGPYHLRYTRNGRHLGIAGSTGHVATFDYKTGTLHSELRLQETCRDFTFLHDQTHYAVAQKKYVFIYDINGVELHRLKAHVEPTRLEFLPYHWLLASVGMAGYLNYQDTSTGTLLTAHRTGMGACQAMTQNPHTAVIYLGHAQGSVTLWTPNLPHPAVQLLAHLGPIHSVAVDPSTAGRYIATSGKDSGVKIWDSRNWKNAVREWRARSGPARLEYSATGALGIATGGTVNVYQGKVLREGHQSKAPPPLYVTHAIGKAKAPITGLRFAPFADVLAAGHRAGVSTLLVPGVGEPNFDSSEADPFEGRRARREREVKNLLDKIQPDMITVDPEMIGSIAATTKLTFNLDGTTTTDIPFARLPRIDRLRVQGKIDESVQTGDAEDEMSVDGEDGERKAVGKDKSRDEREKRKMRGKGKSLKRYLRKQRKNVVDPQTIAIRKKLEKQREQRRVERAEAATAASGQAVAQKKSSALDRFKRTTTTI